jgi:hypothetical protein
MYRVSHAHAKLYKINESCVDTRQRSHLKFARIIITLVSFETHFQAQARCQPDIVAPLCKDDVDTPQDN